MFKGVNNNTVYQYCYCTKSDGYVLYLVLAYICCRMADTWIIFGALAAAGLLMRKIQR